MRPKIGDMALLTGGEGAVAGTVPEVGIVAFKKVVV